MEEKSIKIDAHIRGANETKKNKSKLRILKLKIRVNELCGIRCQCMCSIVIYKRIRNELKMRNDRNSFIYNFHALDAKDVEYSLDKIGRFIDNVLKFWK